MVAAALKGASSENAEKGLLKNGGMVAVSCRCLEDTMRSSATTGSALPPSLAPRGLSRGQAAEYIGVGITLFDKMVEDGRMPKPKRIDGRVVWDKVKVDAAFAELDEPASASGATTTDRIFGR
jgi:predicted DNA-binding transcriptional regulator AlpA